MESKLPVVVLYIISTIRPGSAVGAGRSLYREPSTLEKVLTLPLVNPPISRGLLSNSLLAFLRLRAVVEKRPLDVRQRKRQTLLDAPGREGGKGMHQGGGKGGHAGI